MERRLHALQLPPGPPLARALAAALDGTGPAICPIPPDMPPAALNAMLAALAPAAVQTTNGTRPYDGGDCEPVADDTAVLIATSGSTGTPKIVELSGDALRHSAAATLNRINAQPGDRWLCCLPTSHIAGLQVLVRAHLSGTTPLIHPRFDPSAIAAAHARHLAVVPTQLHRLLEARIDLTRFASILLGGGAAPRRLLARARATGARIFTTYGMTETCGGCVYDGTPLDGVSIDLDTQLDTDTGTPLDTATAGAATPPGVGRIRLAGPVLFTGYRRRPDLTAAARDGRWFRTQDLGTLAGGRLQILGRADDVINTGGKKIAAAEVAAALSRHPAVHDVVVVGRPDPEWGERVTAVIVPDGRPPTLQDLRAWTCRTLPAHAAPRELQLVDAIPLLPSGKPDRAGLRHPTP